jgi:large subunit ribosomal protein L35
MGKKFKMKTHKATAKRFRVTKNGKILRMHGGKSHLRRKKATRTKHKFRGMVEVTNAGDKKRIMRLAPYLKKYKANPPK